MLSDRQSIELFHLLFLQFLKGRLDSSLYVLKGGCNLRFFFNSIRYSEDVDLDVCIVSPETLKKKVDGILMGTPLNQAIAAYGLEIAQISAPKQTPTVQRWKVGIKFKNRSLVIPSKIEFSRRVIELERAAEPVTPFFLQTYQLPQIILPHYLLAAALKQKVDALIHRAETQSRDVFDLHLLFSQMASQNLQADFDLETAIHCVLNIAYNDFSSQVISYLLPEQATYYRNPKEWEKMQLFVIEKLEKYKANEAH